MKIFDPKRHLPLGWDWEGLRTYLCWGHFFSSLSAFAFVTRYFRARDALYVYVEGAGGSYVRELDLDRTILPFGELMTGSPYLGMWCFLAAMAVLVWHCYRSFTRDAMSVYTMRRLPDRWEYHRRCWTLPLLSAAAEVLLFAVLTFLCWLLWRFATPAVCLPT